MTIYAQPRPSEVKRRGEWRRNFFASIEPQLLELMSPILWALLGFLIAVTEAVVVWTQLSHSK